MHKQVRDPKDCLSAFTVIKNAYLKDRNMYIKDELISTERGPYFSLPVGTKVYITDPEDNQLTAEVVITKEVVVTTASASDRLVGRFKDYVTE